MPELWMPGVTRLDIGDHQPTDGGPAKAIPHITWDENATAAKPLALIPYERLVDWFGRNPAGKAVAPHILWDPFTGRVTQFVPANCRSKSLVDQSGGTRTNRAGSVVIQVEALFFPYCEIDGKVYARLADTPCKGWAELHTWVKSWGVADAWPNGRPENCNRDEETWETESGWYPHAAVPENKHNDPLSWPEFPTAPDPAAQETDMPSVLNESNANDVELTSGGPWVGLAFTDAVVHSGPRVHDTIVHLLTDPLTSATAVIEGRFYLTDTAGKTPSAYLPTVKRGGGGHQFVLSGQVPADRHLRFEVRATTADGSPVKLIHRMATGLYWAV
jgi:hypothetical protein